MGFPCPNCGGGKSKNLASMAPPPPSTWDGEIENLREVFDAMVEREPDAMTRTLMKAMMLGPRANLGEDEMMGLMSAMAGRTGGLSGAGDDGPGEGCPQM